MQPDTRAVELVRCGPSISKHWHFPQRAHTCHQLTTPQSCPLPTRRAAYNVAATDATDQCCKDHDFDSIWGTVNGNPLDKRACAAHQRLVNCANAVPFAQVRQRVWPGLASAAQPVNQWNVGGSVAG